ncbi:MAG: hypothetical protein NZ735_03235 [Candidatus Marinimicrobia bacterium]|nr:hypothetical protein [Candidatus Neomarinimicrobiota bacterium]
MNNKTAIILLLSSIWIPTLLDEMHLMEGWASVPITVTFVTIYLLSFLTLFASFIEKTKD